MPYIAGTGTRKIQRLDAEQKTNVLSTIITKLREFPNYTVISGMAEGFDAALATAALICGNPLHCYVPNRGYGQYYWGNNSLTERNRIDEFNHILSQAQEVLYTNEEMGVNSLYHQGIHMNFWRNQQMVDKADVLFAWASGPDEADGGTKDCITRWIAKQEAHLDEALPIYYLKE